MSVEDETWNRPICPHCELGVKFAETERHANGICLKIVNIKNLTLRVGKTLYIGRKNAHYKQEHSIFHNPFVIGVDGTREEVIKKFENYAPANKELMENLYKIDHVDRLVCWCNFPIEDCHGRILFKLREQQKHEQKSLR